MADNISDPGQDWAPSPQQDTTPGAPGAAGTAPAPIPSGQPTDPAQQMMNRAEKQVGNPRWQLPAPHPDKPTRVTSASGLLGAIIMGASNAMANHKQAEIDKNMVFYQGIQHAYDSAQEQAEMLGKPDKATADQLFLNSDFVKQNLVGDNPTAKKNLKGLKDILKIDIMNPESSNTTHAQALGRVIQQGKAKNMMNIIRSVLHAHQQYSQPGQDQPPAQSADAQAQRPLPGALSGGQPQQPGPPPTAAAERLLSRAQPGQVDPKQAQELATAQASLSTATLNSAKAQKELQEKYDYKQDKEGDWFGVSKVDPKDVIRLKDADGKAVSGKAPPKEGQAVLQNGVPVGLFRNGVPRFPYSADWNSEDQKALAVYLTGHAVSQQELDKRWQDRATFYNKTSPTGVLVTKDNPAKGLKAGQLTFVSRDEAARNPGMYAPPTPGDKAMGTQARFGEVQAAMDGMNQAIANMPDSGTGFDASTRAQLSYLLRGPNPNSAMSNFMQSEAAKQVFDLSTPDGEAKAEYVQWLADLAESAQALVSLQGMGARSSDKLRAAVGAMLPGAATPSRKYAQGQMGKLQIEVDQLEKGVPSLGTQLDQQAGGAKSAGASSVSDLVKKYGGR